MNQQQQQQQQQQQVQPPNGMTNGMSMQMQPQPTPGFQNTSLQQSMQPSSFQQHMNLQQSQPRPMGNAPAGSQMVQNPGLQQNLSQQVAQRLTPEEERLVNQLALRMQQTSSQEQVEQVNEKVKAFPPEMLQRLAQQNITPQQYYFKNVAAKQFQLNKVQKARRAALHQQQQLSRQDNGLGNQSNQQVRQTPRNANGLEQSVSGIGQNATVFEAGGNVKNNMQEYNALQQEAMRSQELGHQVVPASNSQAMAPPNQQQRFNMPNTPRQQPLVQQTAQQSATPNLQHQQMLARQQQNEKIQAARLAHLQGGTPQQPPLTGQIGGLTANPGQNVQRQSPAMPTLNKPLEQSTQQGQGQGTPSQRQQQQPTPDQNTLGQRTTQQSQPPNVGPPQVNPTHLNTIISRFPPDIQQRLNSMPPVERTNATLSLMQKNRNFGNGGNSTGRPQGMAPNTFPANGQNMPTGLDQQSRAMLSAQQHSGAQQGFNAPVPQMRSMNQANLQAGQQQWGFQGTPNPQNLPGMMAAHQLSNDGKTQQSQARALSLDQIRWMDNQPFPRTILGAGTTFAGMPQEVRTWGQLKAWATQSPEITKEVVENLGKLQAMHFQSIIAARQNAMNGQGAPPTMSMLSQAPVPTAQMVPTSTQPAMQNGINTVMRPGQGVAMPQRPTMQEVQNYRPRLPPQWRNLTDQQIAEQIYLSRLKAAQGQNQQNMNVRQTPIQAMQQMNNVQRGTSTMQNNQSAQNQQQPNLQVPMKAPASAKPSPNPGNAIPAQQMRVNQPSAPQMMAKGVKRGSADEVVEVPNPNLLQQQAQNQKLGKQGQANQQPGFQQQVHDRAQYEAELRKYATPGAPPGTTKPAPGFRPGQMNPTVPGQVGQQANQQTPPQFVPLSDEEMMQRRARIIQLQQEISHNIPQRPLIPLDADASRNMAVLLQREFPFLAKVEHAIHFYFIKMRGPEPTIRELLTMVGSMSTQVILLITHCHQRFKILGQYRDRIGTPNDYFTMHPQELQDALIRFRQFMQITIRMGTQLQGRAPPPSQPQPMKPVLTEQNLQQNQQAEQQAFQKARQNHIERQHSIRGMKVPAAPTTTQPPISFGFQSPPPNGVPHQYGNQGFTADQLHIPEKKRRKINGPSAANTPVEKKATPGSSASPKVTKDAIPPSVKPIPIAHKCFVANCPISKPFPTAEALAQHKRDAHEAKEPVVEEPAIEDPLAWALESIRIGLGLDEKGNMKPKEQKQEGSVEMAKTASTQGATPMKHEANTPSINNLRTPQPAQSQVKSPLPAKSNNAPTPSKLAQPAPAAPQQAPTPPSNSWDDTPFTPHLLSSTFPSLADLHSSLAANITTLTPSSSTTVSQRSAETSPQTDKDSPLPAGRKSDIGDGNELDMTIRINDGDGDDGMGGSKNKFWPEGFFSDLMFPDNVPLVDEETLGMGWEELFGEVAVDGNNTGGTAGKKRKENDGFDASLFRVVQ